MKGPALLDLFPRRRWASARAPRPLASARAVWTTPRTWTPGELVTALMLNQHIRDNLNILKTNIGDDGSINISASPLRQATRGLILATHPDSTNAANLIALLGLDDVVMDDAVRYAGITPPLTADITASGAGGLDTGARVASTWYEAWLIGKSSTKLISDLRLILHRAKDYKNDQSQTTDNTSDKLRQASNDRVKLAQGFKVATIGPIEFVDLKVLKAGSPTGNVWVTIEGDAAGNPTGTPLATSDKFDVSQISATAGFYRLPFRTPFTPALTSTQYHLVLQGDYAVSGTNYLQWQGNSADVYANGIAKKFDNTAWAAATPADFVFRLYVTENDVALTYPSGYDEKCRLGFVYNSSGNVLVPFFQVDRHAEFISAQGLGAVVVPTTPLFVDLSAFLPPLQVDAYVGASCDTGGTVLSFAGAPYGYGVIKFTSGGTQGVGQHISVVSAGLSSTPMGSPLMTRPVAYQAGYYLGSGGSGLQLFIGGYDF